MARRSALANNLTTPVVGSRAHRRPHGPSTPGPSRKAGPAARDSATPELAPSEALPSRIGRRCAEGATLGPRIPRPELETVELRELPVEVWNCRSLQLSKFATSKLCKLQPVKCPIPSCKVAGTKLHPSVPRRACGGGAAEGLLSFETPTCTRPRSRTMRLRSGRRLHRKAQTGCAFQYDHELNRMSRSMVFSGT